MRAPKPKTLLVAVLFFALFTATVTEGLPVRTLTTANAASSNVKVNVCYPTVSPTVLSPSDGTETKESYILMSGTATPGSTVYGFRNGTQVGFVTAGGDGSFALSISLVVGSNELKASTRNNCGIDEYSNVVTIERKPSLGPPTTVSTPGQPTSPAGGSGQTPTSAQEESADNSETETSSPIVGGRPVILDPKDGTQTVTANVLVRGKANPHTKVGLLLNGKLVAEVTSDENGELIISVGLIPGDNKLELQVKNSDETLTSVSITITYNLNNKAGWISFGSLGAFPVVGIIIGLLLIIILARMWLWHGLLALKARRRS